MGIKRILFLIMALFSFNAFSLTATPALWANNHPYQNAIKIKAVYNDATISTATDPFAGKTNKYCESAVVRVICLTKGCHVKWGSSAPTATGADYLVLANTYVDFVCSPTTPYLSIIEESASAEMFVVEID